MTGPAKLVAPPRDSSRTTFEPLPELHASLRAKAQSSVELTRRCLARIAAVDPLVGAVLALDPSALRQASAADQRFAAGAPLGPLDGIPVLVKDNIDTAGLASSCGSRLLRTPPERDAGVVRLLRACGAVLLGKTNLSEWANFRAVESVEGWSAVGGQTRNPHVLSRSPWGSSSGSAAAVAAGLAPLALGTETDGSIVGPAGICGVAGVKPEPGLLPLSGVCPVSPSQDAVGVLAYRAEDALRALSVLGGQEFDPAPRAARFGRWRVPDMPAEAEAVVDAMTERLAVTGAEIVDVSLELSRSVRADGLRALFAEFRPALEHYLTQRRDAPGSLDELIAGNTADPVELSVFGQELFEQCANSSDRDWLSTVESRGRARDAARSLIDATMREHGLSALLAPGNQPAWPIDHANGDPFPATSSTPAALAGYPVVSVPAGAFGDLPVGVSVFGPATLAGLAAPALTAATVAAARVPRFLP